jgi:hypothetical protein
VFSDGCRIGLLRFGFGLVGLSISNSMSLIHFYFDGGFCCGCVNSSPIAY